MSLKVKDAAVDDDEVVGLDEGARGGKSPWVDCVVP